jgi:cyclopropane-fatty-acyl-phospholipid synthase
MPGSQHSEQALGSSIDAMQHYELGSDFFRLWLGEELVYSSGLWTYPFSVEGLEAAQLAKIRFFAELLDLEPGQRVLDVGCSWGGVLRRLITDYGVQGTGLTLNPAHRDHAIKSTPTPDIQLCNWIEYEPREPFDAVVCFDALEHFARDDYSVDAKISSYRTFFGRAYNWLKDDGVFGLQVFAFDDVGDMTAREDTSFARLMRERIFPEAMPPHLSELVLGLEPFFRIKLLISDPTSYAHTLRAWFYRLRANEVEARGLVGDLAYREHCAYLSSLLARFRLHHWTVFRLHLEKRSSIKV